MAHSYKGILRFHQTVDRNNIFYLAEIEPDCNILPLIAGHFSDRFADQNFVIIDRRRQLLFTHKEDGGFSLRWFASKEIIPDNLSVSDDFDSYWMNYLKHLAIPERANSSLQKSRLPLKYRKHMTEF